MSKNFYRPNSGFTFPSEPKTANPAEPYDAGLGDLLEDEPFTDEQFADAAFSEDEQPSASEEEALTIEPEADFVLDVPEEDAPETQEACPTITAEQLALLCKEHICPHCPAKHEADELRLRSLADLDNARKRLERERQESVRYSTEKVLNDIIPALDNLDLALQHAPKDEGSKNFVVGVDMTKKLMLDALKSYGFEAVGNLGEEFDPACHEAVGMVDAPGFENNQVSAMLSCGYSLNGRLLRPARVVVCKR